MPDRSSIFDMIGPIMIGPSSSHTAGVVRIGKVSRFIHGPQPTKATIHFYNSFARTFEGHGSDRAVAAGLLGFETDDLRIKESLILAKQMGMEIVFRSIPNANAYHPNSVRIEMETEDKKTVVLGISRGGGLISIVEINGFKCNFSAQQHTLIIDATDMKGSIAFISTLVAQDECNIATMTVTRDSKHRNAKMVLEMDSAIRPLSLQYMKSLPWVQNIIFIPDVHL